MVALLAALAIPLASQHLLYLDPRAPLEARVADLAGRLTLEEKVRLLSSQDSFSLFPIPRLGVPSLTLSDGPLGVRWGKATAFPASIATASSWDVDLMHRVGVALGEEFRHKGRAVALGPCVGLVRVPHGGRNFESFGEDPYLNGEMAAAYIRGEQSQGVASCVKHYALNNQELERGSIDIRADERTMRELDLRVFEAAVKKGGVRTVMAAYNKVNGLYCTENPFLLTQVLKNEWGFRGAVMSDWGATHSTVASALAGLDMEMPGPNGWWGQGRLLAAVRKGEVPERLIDDKVRRVLRVVIETGFLERPWRQRDDEMTLHRRVALEAARNGIVLLKNEDAVLPLGSNLRSLAVIGPYVDEPFVGGGGSSEIAPFHASTVLQGLRARLPATVRLVHVPTPAPSGGAVVGVDLGVALRTPDGRRGLLGQYYPNRSLAGEPALTRVDPTVDFDWHRSQPARGLPADNFGVRWTGKLVVAQTGNYEIGMTADDGMRVILNGNPIVDDWQDHAAETRTSRMRLEAGRVYDLRLEYYQAAGEAVARFVCIRPAVVRQAALDAARHANAAVVVVGIDKRMEGEGSDRRDYRISADQEDLVDAIARANPNTIVVMVGGSQVATPRLVARAPAVVEAWYLGQEGGDAVADVLLGRVNPSGKLPMSFVDSWAGHWAAKNYPGNRYSEGIFLGYRYLDQHRARPLFPFGHGLSYTTFAYSGLKLRKTATGFDARFIVRNSGRRAGKEVAQVYISAVSSRLPRPPKELKGFAKVALKPGRAQAVTVHLGPDALTIFDSQRHSWVADAGAYTVLVGASSRDIRLKGSVRLKKEIVQPVQRRL